MSGVGYGISAQGSNNAKCLSSVTEDAICLLATTSHAYRVSSMSNKFIVCKNIACYFVDEGALEQWKLLSGNERLSAFLLFTNNLSGI